MKTLNLLTFLCLTLTAMTLFSCSKGNSPAPPANPGGGNSNPVGSMKINLEYPVDYNSAIQQSSTFELIISEIGGKILLDTIGTINTAIIATLTTNATLVDLTTVYRPISGAPNYSVETYRSVDPSAWGAAKKVVGAIPIPNFPFAQANVDYFHIPLTEPASINPEWQQFYPTLRTEGLSTIYDSATSHLSVAYMPYPGPGHYVYLVLPAAGLYDLHMVTGNRDTVDLSHMSQAAKLHFTLPAPYKLNSLQLNGMPDSNDYTKSLELYYALNPVNTEELTYPPTGFQKYEFTVNAFSAASYSTNYSYADAIPSNLSMISPTSFTSAHQGDSVTVNFKGITPSFYSIQCNIGSITYTEYASPALTTLHTTSFLKTLNAQLLTGKDLSNFTMASIFIENATGMDYTGYLHYACNPHLKTARLAAYTSLLAPL